MKDLINRTMQENPIGSLIAINGLIAVTFIASMELYRVAKEEGLSKTLGVIQILGF